MAEYKYQIRDQKGNLLEGTVTASDESVAVDALQAKGYTILSIAQPEKGLFDKDISKYFIKPKKKDLIMFTRQLSTLIDADVPLVDGLMTLARQTEKESFKNVINEVANSIKGGASLSIALSKHTLFDDFYVSLVKSGEVSGKLQETLLYLADYLEHNAETIAKVRGALTYPAFIIFAIIVVGAVMMTTVLPQLLGVLKESGVEDLPLTTDILIFVTNIINNYIVFMLLGVIALGFGLRYWIKTPGGGYKFDMLKIKFPRLGVVARNVYLARIAETLATLIRSGVPILEALRITSEVVGHEFYKKILLEAENEVRGGGSISSVFERYREIPYLMTSMIAIGEKTGKTDFILGHIKNFYKTEAERDIQNFSQLIEPVLVVFLGGIVFIIVSSILLPIYNLVGAG